MRRNAVKNSHFLAASLFAALSAAGCVRRAGGSEVVPPSGTAMNTPLASRKVAPADELAAPPALEDPRVVLGTRSAPDASKENVGAAASPVSSTAKAKKPKRLRGKVYGAPAGTFDEAMKRQLEGRFDLRADKDNQVRLPHADARHWKRVRFLGVDHLTGFQYGEDHDLVTGAFVIKTEAPPTAEMCLATFEERAFRKLDKYAGSHSEVVESMARWEKSVIPVHRANLRVRVFFSTYEYSVAWAAYPAYPDGCVVFAMGASRADDPARADKVVMRFAKDAFGRVQLRTKELPVRRN